MGNNGGGFLNANSAHPFESPTALTNWLEMFAILACAFALTYTFGTLRPATSARAGRSSVRWPRSCSSGPSSRCTVEFVGNPLFPASVDQAGIGNMEGKETAVRRRGRRAVHGRHDRHEHRRDQLVARQCPADCRARPALQHGARRDHPGRDRRRHVRHARHRRDPGRLHRRPDGRPDARVPRQEGRELRDQDGDDHGAGTGCQHPRLHRARQRRPGRDGRSAQQRTRTASARSCTRTRARPATTVRRSPG